MIDAYRQGLYALRDQTRIRNAWLDERLATVLPAVMQRSEIDLWLIICREYNEDPVILSMLPQPVMSARRRTILALCKNDDGSIDRYSLDRYGQGDYYTPAWKPDDESQADALRTLVEERQPQQIGLNYSADFAFGDGLSHHEYEWVADALGSEWMSRTTSAEGLCVGWLETRSPAEMAAYPHLIHMGHALIATAFSSQVIHPGVTTTDDVMWWMRQTMHDMGLAAWFQPNCSIQADGQHYDADNPRTRILPGDLLWCDVGFSYLGLCTDQQQHAYVLRPGEQDAPQALREALVAGNRLQDILMSTMKIGMTGNEILSEALANADTDGLHAQIYSHPLGVHGHAAGPTIGLWDQQDGVPGRGDYSVYDHTVYSIELNIKTKIADWNGQDIRIALEEDALMRDGEMQWLAGRQEQLHIIG